MLIFRGKYYLNLSICNYYIVNIDFSKKDKNYKIFMLLFCMDNSRACNEMYAWWVDLLVSYGLKARNEDPLQPETKVALAQDNGVICFKYSPRRYFFGVDSDRESVFWYVFVPEIEERIIPEKRQFFCSELEMALNAERDSEFNSLFTLPVKTDYTERQFAERNYSGVLVKANAKRDLFTKQELSQRALKSWRKNVFVPTCKFLDARKDLCCPADAKVG